MSAGHGWAVQRLLLVRYGARVHESRGGNSDSDLDARGPAAEQVMRIDTGRVVRGQVQALVVAVAGEIDLLTVERLCAAVAAAFDELGDGEILVVDLTDVTFLGSPGCRHW
jgi:hypothetical protein